MIYRPLGRTGEKVSVLGLGGAHIGRQPEEQESIRIIRTAIDHGITFMDNCWDYNGGDSERRMGKALRDGYREKVFLMTKIDGRTKQSAAEQIDESLRRLRDRSFGPAPVPRGHPAGRPGPNLRRAAGPWRPCRPRKRRARFALSALPATRTRWSTCGCSTWPGGTASASIRCRCR